MSARRPNVPHAVRPSPHAADRTAAGAPPAKPGTHPGSVGGPPADRVRTKPPAGAAPAPQPVPTRKHATPSEVRAAEREQLAGSIRRTGASAVRPRNRVIVPAEDAKPIPAQSFSGRLLALALVLVAVIVLLVPSVSNYLRQQGEVSALREQIAEQQQAQEQHRADLARWDDPAYIKQQARERIFLVMPGEKRYLVKGGSGIEESTGTGSAGQPEDLPWVDSLWESVSRAATD
ncbi:septum formation initiator family protein [uncultured Arthrobacter sp.]|uniref:FtsB family cell division protein n=1 Tax=uncultured Arthrobacter sp. TaxID=114050 RepID=UPI0025EFF7D3|nr:septum formation initiator family protein [uncultured Arthrobacter sp.]